MKILLFGNPNVGKSAVFSRLTGTQVIISNYGGTTVEFTQGSTVLRSGEIREVIDAPGTYSLDATCKAEEVAVSMLDDKLKEGDIVVNVVDSTHLERNLYLTLQLLERGIPMVVALNLWDETKHKGISIDVEKLQDILGVPVIATSALTGEGIDVLMDKISALEDGEKPSTAALKHRKDQPSADERWSQIGKIIKEVQTICQRRPTLRDRLEDASIRPIGGLIMAVIIMYLSFNLVVWIGEGLIDLILDPLFEGIVRPAVSQISLALGSQGLLHDLLIGYLFNGEIDFEISMGLLTTGIYIPIAMVLPYICAFYVVLSTLEDVGYLPRLAVLVDNIMHALGMHGYAIIPMILGFGCTVPAAMATRVLESRREKFICATMLSIGIPCMSQTAMVVGLIGRYGWQYIAIIYGVLFVMWLTVGLVLNTILPGSSLPLIAEIPPYRFPHPLILGKKVWMRVRAFLAEAVPYVLLGVLFVNLLYVSGFIDFLGKVFAPFLSGLFGLPPEAIAALLMGFLRKDVAVGMLSPLGISGQQLIVAAIVLTAYFPCAATFIVLLRELGPLDMLKSALIMLVVSFGAGGLTNFVLARRIPALYVITSIIALIIIVYSSARLVRIRKSRREDVTL